MTPLDGNPLVTEIHRLHAEIEKLRARIAEWEDRARDFQVDYYEQCTLVHRGNARIAELEAENERLARQVYARCRYNREGLGQ